MKSKQVTFFATKSDIITLMDEFERIYNKIIYTPMGMFDSAPLVIYDSFREINITGYTDYNNWISLDNRFLILEKENEIKIREVFQKSGEKRYAVDQLLNPRTVELSIGGIYRKSHNVLVAGRLAILSDNNFSVEVYKLILSEFKRNFFKVKDSFVGNEAYEKLKEGWRLVTNEKSPREYDLTLN